MSIIKVASWYDNEMGYSNKIVDFILYMHSVDSGLGKLGEKSAATKT